MGNVIPESYLPPPSQPWGRELTNRLESLENRFDNVLNDTNTSVGDLNYTLNYLSGFNTYSTIDNAVYTNTNIGGGTFNLVTITLNFEISRTSKMLITSQARTTSNAQSTSGVASTLLASTLVSNIVSINGIAQQAENYGSRLLINTTSVTVYHDDTMNNQRFVELPAGRHTITSLWNSTNTATAQATRTIYGAFLSAAIVG